MDRIAAIDIGTNTFRMLIAGRGGEWGFFPVARERNIVRLGEGSLLSKKISDQALARGIYTLRGFAEKMKYHEVNKCSAAATGVMRKAANAHEFLERVKNECGLSVKVISGEEEAWLTLKGVELLFPKVKRNGAWIIFDIGGGSTELIYSEDGNVKIIESLDLGVVTLADRIYHDPPSEEESNIIHNEIERVLRPAIERIKNRLEDNRIFLVGTAGTVTTLAAMDQGLLQYQSEKINSYVLKKDAVQEIFYHLILLREKEREELPGLEKGRGKVILPGCAILLAMMEFFQVARVSVSDFGILEGIIREILVSLDSPEKLV
jgi:exopolyphosphatase/guanosine-5'-triphosphate,3'-diphosphate pyrophosphatase